VRILEAFNGISGLVVERTAVSYLDQAKEFDGIWISSLTDSTARGKPDTELVAREARLDTINQILEVTTKPIIVDGDSGGMPDHFRFFVKTLERLGVSAVIIEDKVGPKANSFAPDHQTQEDIERFCEKIAGGKHAQLTAEFMVIARIESLIVGSGMEDAIRRASAYGEAGADAIMIHSKAADATEVLEFIRRYRSSKRHLPIVVVPTTYNRITAMDLHAHGVSIVIYANHLLRSAYPAMVRTARSILEHDCAHDADEKHCLPVLDTLKLAPSA
jgi:phosphoenolpyruvate phosphomutase